MIGNDIIDLPVSRRESNWQRKGWLDKLFTPQEQNEINAANDPEQMVWLLWSMKEAAYKIWNRDNRQMLYAPVKFVCRLVSIRAGKASGTVAYQEQIYHTNSQLTADFIHTVASLQNNCNAATVYIDHTKEQAPRFPDSHVFFKDVDGIPQLLEMATGKLRAISRSHHGRFEALAFYA